MIIIYLLLLLLLYMVVVIKNHRRTHTAEENHGCCCSRRHVFLLLATLVHEYKKHPIMSSCRAGMQPLCPYIKYLKKELYASILNSYNTGATRQSRQAWIDASYSLSTF